MLPVFQERKEWKNILVKFLSSSRRIQTCQKLWMMKVIILLLNSAKLSSHASSIAHHYGHSIEHLSHLISTGKTWELAQFVDAAKLASSGSSHGSSLVSVLLLLVQLKTLRIQ